MAVSNVNQIGEAWASGVQGKQGKFERAFARSRDDVLEGLRAIGANPGPNYSQAVQAADPGQAAQAWATKVEGKQSKMQQNWIEAIES